ncbi:MAG: hypothetical protein ABII16_03460 [Patescibacteria group bacterium]
MSIGRPATVIFKETSIKVFTAIFKGIATVVKGVFSVFLGGLKG